MRPGLLLLKRVVAETNPQPTGGLRLALPGSLAFRQSGVPAFEGLREGLIRLDGPALGIGSTIVGGQQVLLPNERKRAVHHLRLDPNDNGIRAFTEDAVGL